MTQEALAAGALSTAHAAVIAHTTSRLPESLTEEERAKVESALVAQASSVDPARLRRSARRALLAAERTAAEADAHEDAELRGEEARAEARMRLTMHDNLDGTVTGHFTVPTLAGAILRKTIQQMASPRRRGPGGGADRGAVREVPGRAGRQRCRARGLRGGGRPGGQRVGRRRDARRCSGRRLGAPLRHRVRRAARAPAHRPAERQGRRHRRRHHRPRAVAPAVSAPPTSTPATTSRPRDATSGLLGRRRCPRSSTAPRSRSTSAAPNRFFTEAQRVALATTYDECAAEGCDRPYAWCDLHHEDPWARGGATAPAVPLCAYPSLPSYHHPTGIQRSAPLSDHRVHSPALPTAARPAPDRPAPATPRAAVERLRVRTGRALVAVAALGAAAQDAAGGRGAPRPATTGGVVSTGSGAGVRGRPASRTASARARRSSVVGWGSG